MLLSATDHMYRVNTKIIKALLANIIVYVCVYINTFIIQEKFHMMDIQGGGWSIGALPNCVRQRCNRVSEYLPKILIL